MLSPKYEKGGRAEGQKGGKGRRGGKAKCFKKSPLGDLGANG